MGDFTLGCLLGQYDGTQSFDVASADWTATTVGSWQKLGAQSSWYPVHGVNSSTFVHSSGQGFRALVSSNNGGTFMLYSYKAENDAFARWFPDVTTHGINWDAWAFVDSTVDSGALHIQSEPSGGGNTIVPIPHQSPTLKTPHLSGTSTVWSISTANRPDILISYFQLTEAAAFTLYMDDFVTQIDQITLHPEYSFQERAQVVKSQYRTLGGDLHTYTWAKHFAYNVPLEYLSTSHANLLNWWWTNQFNLAFTLDTSDAESTFIVKIVNDKQPIHTLHRPYRDQWKGVLQLESINNGSLVF